MVRRVFLYLSLLFGNSILNGEGLVVAKVSMFLRVLSHGVMGASCLLSGWSLALEASCSVLRHDYYCWCWHWYTLGKAAGAIFQL